MRRDQACPTTAGATIYDIATVAIGQGSDASAKRCSTRSRSPAGFECYQDSAGKESMRAADVIRQALDAILRACVCGAHLEHHSAHMRSCVNYCSPGRKAAGLATTDRAILCRPYSPLRGYGD